ncbi:MAG: hypothetical protein MUE85_22070 [Microscillaceae bacterium]|jgi:hypothetical protein|nr:hypothetical protein [Microscillaceae bacterium]
MKKFPYNFVFQVLLFSLLVVFSACKQDDADPQGELAECRLKADSLNFGVGSSQLPITYKYFYDNQGRVIKSESRNTPQNGDFTVQNYTYDNQGFLTKMEGKRTTIPTGSTIQFTLDFYHNYTYTNGLLSKVERFSQFVQNNVAQPIAPSVVDNLTYDNQQRLSLITSTGNQSFTFSYNGNMVTRRDFFKLPDNTYSLQVKVVFTYDTQNSPYSKFKIKGIPRGYFDNDIIRNKNNITKVEVFIYSCPNNDCACNDYNTCDESKYDVSNFTDNYVITFGAQSLPTRIDIDTDLKWYFVYADCK